MEYRYLDAGDGSCVRIVQGKVETVPGRVPEGPEGCGEMSSRIY